MIHERPSVVGDRLNLGVQREKWKITSDDIISRMQSGKLVRWSAIPTVEILGVLKKASQEVQIPVSMFNIKEFRQPLKILGEHTLLGLYNFARSHKERGEKDIIPFLFQLTGVRVTTEDVIVAMKKNKIIQWDSVPREVIKALLEKVAHEFDKTVNTLLVDDLLKPSEALGGKSLGPVYKHFKVHPDRKRRPVMIFLLENCGIAISLYNKLSSRGEFLSKVSPREIRELLIEAGKELGKPPSMLTSADLDKHFRFLNGQTLRRRTRSADGRATRVSLRKNADIEVTFNDVIEIARRGNNVIWIRIPMQVIREILVKAADEIGIPVSSILGKDMQGHRFNFLGGKTLGGLYYYVCSHKEKMPQETSTAFLRRKLGLPEISRSSFRMQKAKESFAQLVSQEGLSKDLDVEELMPWIQAVANLYEDPFLNIGKEEIVSEEILFITEAIGKGLAKDDIIKKLYEYLEGFRRRESQKYYKEKLLSTPIGDGDSILQDVIASKDPEVELGEEGLSERLAESLKVLTPFHQKLVIAIAVDEKTLDELAEELGLDRDTIEEHYADTLILLRNRMESEEEE